jgi:ribosomal protein S20
VSATQKFREQVLAILREEFPGKTFTPDPENEGSLKHEGFTLSLANLWSQYQQELRSEEAQEDNEALRSSTKHFVRAVLNAPAGIGKRQSWAEAASQLYPFIVNMVTVRNLERNAVCPHFQIFQTALGTCWSRT